MDVCLSRADRATTRRGARPQAAGARPGGEPGATTTTGATGAAPVNRDVWATLFGDASSKIDDGTRPEPFNFTPMGVNPISSGSPHVRPMGRTCGEPDEIKKNTHPKIFTALFGEQATTATTVADTSDASTPAAVATPFSCRVRGGRHVRREHTGGGGHPVHL